MRVRETNGDGSKTFAVVRRKGKQISQPLQIDLSLRRFYLRGGDNIVTLGHRKQAHCVLAIQVLRVIIFILRVLFAERHILSLAHRSLNVVVMISLAKGGLEFRYT